MLEQVLQQDVIVTGVSFTMEAMEISYLVNSEQSESASIARVIEIRMDTEELVGAYLELQDFICTLVTEGEVMVRNPPVRQGGGLETLYRRQHSGTSGDDDDQ